MTYINPQNTSIPTIGIDGTITVLQAAIGAISWVDKCFHRAYNFQELPPQGGTGTKQVPKTWEAQNEWYNNLPNDNLPAQAFFYVQGDEDTIDAGPENLLWESDISLIVWVNTSKLVGHTTGPSLAQEKADVLTVLQASDLVTGIDSIIDKSASDIFDPFDVEDAKNHFTMLPFAGFRVNFRVKYTYDQCLPVSS
jgi:hypothetical protein